MQGINICAFSLFNIEGRYIYLTKHKVKLRFRLFDSTFYIKEMLMNRISIIQWNYISHNMYELYAFNRRVLKYYDSA